MRKCTKCYDNSDEEAKAKEAKLWQQMVDSLTHFTDTSTALVKGMQNKLGIPPDSDPDKKIYDPCGILEELKVELKVMETDEKVPSACTCTSQSNMMDDSDATVEVVAGIACYKPPRVIRKKKYKYSSEIESKLLAQKKRPLPCQCNKDGGNMTVDACICKNSPEKFHLREAWDETTCPITICSSLAQEEIQNIHCDGGVAEQQVEEHKDDPLAWIRKPGSFNPDKLPQDDNHPYVIKTEDNIQIEDHSLGYALFNAMKKFGDNIAQIDDSSGQSESYSAFAKKCVLVAMRLRNEFSKNNIIGIYTDNHKNTYVPYLGGLFNGNRVVAFDRFLNKKGMIKCLENVTPSVMFVSNSCLTFLQECMQTAEVNFKIVLFGEEEQTDFVRFESYLDDNGTSTDDFEAEQIGPLDETCLICFNGGIPESKAVCLSHDALLRQSLRIVSFQYVPPNISIFLENAQISSLLVLFSSILNGATRIIVDKFREETIWKMVEKYQINALHLYPHQCIRLADLPDPAEDTSSLAYIFTGGEKLQSNALARLKEILLRTLICQTYEHTELTGFVAAFNFSKPEDSIFSYFRTQSCGRPIEGVCYKVINMKNGKIVHQLTPGELFVKSNLIRNGYFIKNVEEHCDKQNWISTGDLVYYDTYKCFHHINRINDLIKFRDKIIIPSKLEDILLSHPLIVRAVVIAISNEEDGQHAAAVVSLKENEDIYSKDLEDWFKSRVPEEEQLRGGVTIVSNIPYLPNGKIDRRGICPLDPEKC